MPTGSHMYSVNPPSETVTKGSIPALALASALVIAAAAPQAVSGAQQRPTFGATVARVRVDVIVTDQQGRFVDDLGTDDFRVYEDGVEQEIIGIQVVDLLTGSLTSMASGSEPVTVRAADFETPAGDADLTEPLAPSMASEFGAIIYLVDLPGLTREHKNRFALEWDRHLEQIEFVGAPRAVYMIDQVGRLEELVSLTFDVERLRKGVAKVHAAPLTRSGLQEQIIQAADILHARDEAGMTIWDLEQMNDLSVIEAEERGRANRTLDLLTSFCNALSTRRGRTALVWVSSEIQITEAGPGRALMAAYVDNKELPPGDTGGQAGVQATMRRPGAEHYTYLSPSTDATERLRRLFDAANSANVSIYSLDPIPVTELRRLAADPRVSTPAVRDLLDSSAVQSAMEGLKDGLWQAADETGGRAYIGATELGGALTGINDDTGRFYLLNYAPPEPHGDGAFHSIRVEVDRRDVQVRARKGYVDLSPEARQAVALRAALSVPGAVSGLPFAAVAQRRWSSKGDPVVQLVVAPEGDAEEMSAFSPSSAQASHLFHAVALDEEGTVISEVHQEMHALNVGSGASFRPPVYVHEWALEPGRYELRVVLQDGITGEIGATRVDVEVPRPSVDWSTSDLVVMVASGGGPQPLVDSRIVTDETLLTYVEVVGGRNPILAGDIFTADGSRRLAILPDLPMGMDSAGIHRGAHRIRGMPPGDYLLQIIVVDPAVAEERMFRQRVRVLSSSEIR